MISVTKTNILKGFLEREFKNYLFSELTDLLGFTILSRGI